MYMQPDKTPVLSIIFQIRIYSVHDHIEDQEDQLEEILLSFPQLPQQLEFLAIVYPFV